MIVPVALWVVLTNGLVSVPPSHWQGIELPFLAARSVLDIDFEVTHGSRVQLLLLNRQQSDRFERGRSVTPEVTTGFENSGRVRYAVPVSGDYVLMIDNRIEGRAATLVKLKVEVTSPTSAVVRELPAQKRRLVVSLSLLFFGAVVVFSAREFLRHT